MRQTIYLQPDSNRFNRWWLATFFMLALFVITLLLWVLDERQLDGVSVWSKPLKFESSIVLYFVTLAVLGAFLSTERQRGALWRWLTRLGIGAAIFEIAYIFLQAARGRASHFNNDTPVESVMYALMGVGAVTMVCVSFYLGWLLYREHKNGEWSLFRLSAAWGLMAGSVLTLIIAGTMSSSTSHFAGTPAVDAATVPVLGWVLSGGDLRIQHFFASHLMQFLPLYGLWLEKQTADYAAGRRRVQIFTAVYCGVLVIGFLAAFPG
jgi:hypothetical protein